MYNIAMEEIALVLFVNIDGEILLHLKDDDPRLTYPNRWTFPEGSLSPEEEAGALVRGIQEDHGISSKQFKFYKQFQHTDKEKKYGVLAYVFMCRANLQLLNVKLYEGQKIQYFALEEIQKLHTAPIVKIIVQDLLAAKNKLK